MLTCATLVAALLAAAPGDVLTLAPGQDCGPVTVRNRQWAAPVTLLAQGATIRDLVLWDVRGFGLIGGTVKASAGFAGAGAKAYAAFVRGDTADIRFSGVTFTGAVRGLVIIGNGVTVEGGRFESLRAEGVNMANVRDVRVLGNRFRDFHPIPTKCVVGETIIERLARRDCIAKGGVWTDGDHADAVQMWGNNAHILIAGNDVSGVMQSIGHHGSDAKDRPERVRIVDNTIRSAVGWGIRLHNCADCEVSGNDVGRVDGGQSKLQISVIGTTGRLCGNANPDARLTDITARPCPDAPKGAVGRNAEFGR